MLHQAHSHGTTKHHYLPPTGKTSQELQLPTLSKQRKFALLLPVRSRQRIVWTDLERLHPSELSVQVRTSSSSILPPLLDSIKTCVWSAQITQERKRHRFTTQSRKMQSVWLRSQRNLILKFLKTSNLVTTQ